MLEASLLDESYTVSLVEEEVFDHHIGKKIDP
jgi:hypothetical protein